MAEQGTTTNLELSEQAKEVYREAKPWVKVMGRLGYTAKGIVYITLGLLVLRALSGFRSADVDTRDALLAIENAPLGGLLLILLAFGLLGYVLWRLIQAILDPEGRGTSLKGLSKRLVYIISGLAYSGLVLLAVQMVIGPVPYGGNATEDWTARLLSHRYGQWLVILIGAGTVAVGLYQFYLAGSAIFRQKLKEHEMTRLERLWTITSGRVGFITRGLVICAIGFFMIQAAIHYNPEEAAGLGEILLAFASTSYGPWLLGMVGLGFIAFGVYIILVARYGRYIV